MRSAQSIALVLITLASAACGGSAPPPKAATAEVAPAHAPAAAPTTTAAVAPKTSQLTRSQVRAAIRSGLGVFFQSVALEDYPVMKDGKFHGFRIKAMHPDWRIDLVPGDVVVKVNGMPIEHPEEADAALRSLEKAASLEITYERNGAAAVFRLPIVDEGAAPAATVPVATQPAATAATAPASPTAAAPATVPQPNVQGKRAR